jgi:hypothetical protein
MHQRFKCNSNNGHKQRSKKPAWRYGRNVPPKRRLIFNGLHGTITQKIELFITAAVRIPNPTKIYICTHQELYHHSFSSVRKVSAISPSSTWSGPTLQMDAMHLNIDSSMTAYQSISVSKKTGTRGARILYVHNVVLLTQTAFFNVSIPKILNRIQMIHCTATSECQCGNLSLIYTRTYLHHGSRPVANLTCSQKITYYSGIKIFNNLPSSLKSLMNDKAKFKVALKQYLNTHAFYSVDEFLLSKNDSSF